MKKNTLIPVIIIVLLLLGIGVFLMMNKKQTQPSMIGQTQNSNTAKSGETNQNSPVTQKASLKSLMGMNKQQCQFSDTQSGSSGKMYVADGKMRGDYSMTFNDKNVGSHIISDGNYFYMWSDGSPSGFKYSIKTMEEIQAKANNKTTTNTQEALDMNRQMDYSCGSWSVDSSVFTVPADKKFEDYSAMMEKANSMMKQTSVTPGTSGGSTESNPAACAACSQLSGDAKAQCLTALKCE